MTAKPAPKTRDPEGTRQRIRAAAKAEFANKGMGGARVDAIALKAGANKQLMYHYFGNKDDLFRIVLEEAYAEFRSAEAALELERTHPVTALIRLVTFTWDYYLANPEFLTLVTSENLHKARHIKESTRMREMSRQFVKRMQTILDRGAEMKLFRPDVDPVQLHITIASIGYHYLNNRYTSSVVFERDLMSKKALKERLNFNIKTVLRLVCTAETLKRLEETS
jgi:AcrR family transcriptional regulator